MKKLLITLAILTGGQLLAQDLTLNNGILTASIEITQKIKVINLKTGELVALRTDGYLNLTSFPKTKYIVEVEGFKHQLIDTSIVKKSFNLITNQVEKIATIEEVDNVLAQL